MAHYKLVPAYVYLMKWRLKDNCHPSDFALGQESSKDVDPLLPSQTLTLARDYAAEVRKPFPEIDDKILEEKDCPKDCYVFEGKEKEPMIVYMPLFNRHTDANEFKAMDMDMEEFSTFQRPFSQEKIEFVLETAKANIKNNKETLLREINKAVLRRQNKE